MQNSSARTLPVGHSDRKSFRSLSEGCSQQWRDACRYVDCRGKKLLVQQAVPPD